MIAFVILSAAIMFGAFCLIWWKLGEKQAFIALFTIFPLAFFLFISGVKSNLVGDAEKYQFYLHDEKHEMYYDHDEDQYFILSSPNMWNPLKWIEKQCLEEEDVDIFLEAYNEYEKASEELDRVNVFDYND